MQTAAETRTAERPETMLSRGLSLPGTPCVRVERASGGWQVVEWHRVAGVGMYERVRHEAHKLLSAADATAKAMCLPILPVERKG